MGYGDIAPATTLGQVLASIIMICGYGIIAVPTGIVSAEMVRSAGGPREERACTGCEARFHDPDAVHCKYCGEKLEAP
ncbi:hypothetical protein GF1_09810 [Desulfolithobacter dissulfuricans]|uniref:Potassium channel domain-containing protein n=1 Tax=Desulfolithobacter dissulfuricans TaxID=2795293 RepID=A0A915XHZ2_9BACT|nr:hypothetical protein GF1_09810 [Desulfolithobacter dissulfuricans]